MYTNVGSKIRVLSQVLGWLSLIAGFFTWLILITNSSGTYYDGEPRYITTDDYIGWIALVYGIVGFISSWFIYGFGQLIDDVQDILYYVGNRPNGSERSEKPAHDPIIEQKVINDGGWKCSCGAVNPKFSSSCSCGKSRYND